MKTTATAILALCLCVTGCAAMSEFGAFGVTLRFQLSAAQDRAGQDLDMERDDEHEIDLSTR